MTQATYIPDLRVEIAFNAGVRTTPASRTWTDVSDYVELDKEVTIDGGRNDEKSDADANVLNLIVDNTDGRFTPDYASGAYYPNVKVGRPIRVTALYPAAREANLLTGEDADFEGGIGSWTAGGTVPPTLSSSSAQAYEGSDSMLVTWGTGGVLPLAQRTVTGLTIGQDYTIAVYVRVTSGSPAVLLTVGGAGTFGTPSSTTDAWERISYSFTATATSHNFQLWPQSSPTSGDTVYVDAAMIVASDEVGEFNTLTPIESTRFLGFIDAWPVSWPEDEDTYSVARITATSRQARMGKSTAQSSLAQQTIIADAPLYYWPLGEPEGSTVAQSYGSNDNTLVPNKGTVAFGNEFGAATDSGTAASFTDGDGRLKGSSLSGLTGDWTIECLYRAITRFPGTNNQIVFTLGDGDATYFEFRVYPVASPVTAFVTCADASATFLNITTEWDFVKSRKHIALTFDESAGTVELFVDGVSVGTDTDGSFATFVTDARLFVGEVSGSEGDEGAVSHVAIFDSILSDATIADHADAILEGFLDDTPGGRLDRYAALGGIVSTSYDTGSTELQLANLDLTGKTVLDSMRLIAATDGGVLFDARDGTHTYQALDARYTATSAVSLSFLAGELGVKGDAPYDRAYVVNQAKATYPAGETPTVEDATSVTDLDPASASLEVVCDYDGAYGAAAWLVGRYAEPRLRIPDLELRDLTHLDPTKLSAVLGLDVGSLVTTTNWPGQAPASTIAVFVEGYSERFGLASHRLSFNVSPAEIWTDVFILDTSLLDSTDPLGR